jgi:hypothetical protein
MSGRTIRAAAVSPLLLLLNACSSEGGAAVAPRDTHETAAVSSTSTAPPATVRATVVTSTTTPPPSTTLATGAQVTGNLPSTASLNCPSTGPSVGFGNVRFIDLDGNGNDEVFRAYMVNNTWRVALEDGAGVAYDDEALLLMNPVVAPQAGTDVNGDGRQEAFIVVGADPSTAYLGLYSLVGCDLTRAYDSGQPALFRVGAAVTHIDGVKCYDHNGDGTTDIVQYHGTSTDGITFTVSTSVFTLLPAGYLVPSLAPPPLQTTSPSLYSTMNCGDLVGLQY